jgi:hypothetical protein
MEGDSDLKGTETGARTGTGTGTRIKTKTDTKTIINSRMLHWKSINCLVYSMLLAAEIT